MGNGIGGHQLPIMQKDEWLTPPEIIDLFPTFDLDPCSPKKPIWEIARRFYTKEDNGLMQDWFGRVWLNPPYGKETSIWMEKLKKHNNGIALIFARTETKTFFKNVWNGASSIFFLEGRLYFHHVDGTKAKANSGAPSVLISYGAECKELLRNLKYRGKWIDLQ